MLGSYNRKKQSKIVAAEGERKENPTKMEQGKKKEHKQTNNNNKKPTKYSRNYKLRRH